MDKLNSLSYAYHYRNIDSTEHYARQALQLSLTASEGNQAAEALNNLAFASIVRMDYTLAQRQLDSVPTLTDNQLELLVADIQQMRLCQRRSRNREFYDFRERALRALSRINEERQSLDDRHRRRLVYAESELAIVTSTYYYYVGQEQQSAQALNVVSQQPMEQDTAQWLNYLYNVGAGGVITEGTAADIYERECEMLLRCFQIARRDDYPYFAANALEALAEHLIDPAAELSDLSLINPEGMSDEMLPQWLADGALTIFRDYGDVYQIAGAYRTLASCFIAQGDYESALFNLDQSLADSAIYQAPDLVASIREQLSVAYAGLNDKPMSDENRNLYLDVQEETRQDRQLEARATQLDRTVRQLNWILLATVGTILLLCLSLWFFNRLNRRERRRTPLDDLLEERQEQLAVLRLAVEKLERTNLEQRAKVSLVNSILPLIDRMLHEVHRLDGPERDERLQYISELTDQINADNDVLTRWIQLRQGQLTLRIESFPLQQLFDIIARSRTSFELRQLTLHIEPTQAVVKSDRILTLFMLNTLADNARKFTPAGGSVSLSATEGEGYVEVSVSDTGEGISAEQLAHLFDHKPITDDPSVHSHGFGLLNCKGIIEKYRKMSSLFSVCTLAAESEQGRGSRFYFRLPKGGWPLAVSFWLLAFCQPLTAHSPLDRAAVYADSAYFSNVNGTYERTMLFADSCRYFLNVHYRQQPTSNGQQLMLALGDLSTTPPEIAWLHDSVKTNYNIILDIRNESAVAALALHRWTLYQYNNRIYTQLFKELSADASLAAYCRTMQQSQSNKVVAIVLLVLVLLALLPAYYFLYLRRRLNERFRAERTLRDQVEATDDDIRRAELEQQRLHVANAVLDNCLSALKHETMYYPSRIRQLVDQGDTTSLTEVTAYYRELYSLLSQQAMHQIDHVKLHLEPLADGIWGDRVLISYLDELLRREGWSRQGATAHDDRYVVLTYSQQPARPEGTLRLRRTANLFSPSVENVPYLLCRQIVRDHGEATNRRGCSIVCQPPLIKITLPAYYGKL